MTSSISLVNVGTAPNDGTGASIRSAFQTMNNNWSYVTSYSINTAVNNSLLYANTGVRKFVINGAGTLSNVWVSLPATSADGQEMLITSMIPITSCFVNQNGQNVEWLANSFASSGNVTVRLTYTTTNNRWMTF
jgi:hypothetical protein